MIKLRRIISALWSALKQFFSLRKGRDLNLEKLVIVVLSSFLLMGMFIYRMQKQSDRKEVDFRKDILMLYGQIEQMMYGPGNGCTAYLGGQLVVSQQLTRTTPVAGTTGGCFTTLKKMNSKRFWNTYKVTTNAEAEGLGSRVKIMCMRVVADPSQLKFNHLLEGETENTSCGAGTLEIYFEQITSDHQKQRVFVKKIPINLKTLPGPGRSGGDFDTIYECKTREHDWNLQHPQKCGSEVIGAQGEVLMHENFIPVKERTLDFVSNKLEIGQTLPIAGLGK